MTVHDLSEVPSVRAGRKGAVFVMRGDLKCIEADAFALPTDSFGTVEDTWGWLAGMEAAARLNDRRDDLDRDGGAWLGPVGARSVLALNVGGRLAQNSVDGLTGRLAGALELLEVGLRPWQPRHRARPLLAMPLIGVSRGGLDADTGDVILAVLECIEAHFGRRPNDSRGFDVVLVCQRDSDYAAVQHARREPADVPVPEWLTALVERARAGELAVIFGAGVSASLGLPMWPALLATLVDLINDPAIEATDLARLDPIDAATILIESSGEEIFKARLRDILHRDRHALTHGLIASLQPPLAITTNYDKGYELAARAVNNEVATVLPWDSPASNRSARILKLHGDLDLGQIVLSRDQFVSMNAFRRPLSGILQERMMIGHVLAVGTSMSDATLVHAAEEVRALVSRTPSGTRRGKSGTIIFTEPDPARARLMKDTFEIADAGERGDLTVTLEAARNVDLLLDWLAMQSSSELSFVLDERYRSLLTTTDRRVAALIEAFREGYRATAGADVSELDRAVTAFLTSVGAPEPKG